jgi:protein arginine kinase activator
MKCQKCEKQAVFHITELESGSVRELHFCEDHARAYLNQAEGGSAGPAEAEPASGGGAGVPGVAQTADELAVLDQKACEMCGITFFEFRNQGRLGCAHDYVFFAKELEPLIANVHGSTEHAGRRPEWARGDAAVGVAPAAAAPGTVEQGTEELTGIIGLRRGMRQAIATEDYEKARENRDAIKVIEERRIPPLGQP